MAGVMLEVGTGASGCPQEGHRTQAGVFWGWGGLSGEKMVFKWLRFE